MSNNSSLYLRDLILKKSKTMKNTISYGRGYFLYYNIEELWIFWKKNDLNNKLKITITYADCKWDVVVNCIY